MKTCLPHPCRWRSGFTLVEALVLIGIIAIVLALIPHPHHSAKARAQRIACLSNLKHVGLASHLWSHDFGGQFPFASTNTNSSVAWVNSPQVFRHYQAISNKLNTPKVLTCPADKERAKATEFAQLSNTNLSYFVGLDAREEAPQSILSGDRNVTGGAWSGDFLRTLTPRSEAGWTAEMHQFNGNVGLADGSVSQFSANGLRQHLAGMTNAVIRLAVP